MQHKDMYALYLKMYAVWGQKILDNENGYSIEKAYKIDPLFGSLVEQYVSIIQDVIQEITEMKMQAGYKYEQGYQQGLELAQYMKELMGLAMWGRDFTDQSDWIFAFEYVEPGMSDRIKAFCDQLSDLVAKSPQSTETKVLLTVDGDRVVGSELKVKIYNMIMGTYDEIEDTQRQLEQYYNFMTED